MKLKSTAWIFAVFFIALGLLGYVPALVSDGALFGVFLAGSALNTFYILVGILGGSVALLSDSASKTYFKSLGVIFALMVIFGLIGAGSVLGFFEVNAANNLLHFAASLVALSLGFGMERKDAGIRHAHASGRDDAI